MILSRNTVCQHFEIRSPRWKKKAVGLALHRIGTHNQINVLARSTKDDRLYFPDDYYISGEQINAGVASGEYETDFQKGVKLVVIPISELELLEREK